MVGTICLIISFVSVRYQDMFWGQWTSGADTIKLQDIWKNWKIYTAIKVAKSLAFERLKEILLLGAFKQQLLRK